jgi:geranylgeranyl pyrophosphate synthase
MSDDSVQQRIYGPVEKDLDKVVEELLSQSDRIPENTTGIEDRLKHVLSTPGKRIRPAITLLVAGLWGKTTTNTVVKMATAIELLHIATLVHDDTVDKADTRRGHATASNLWGRNIAVLLGDHIFATSAVYVCETGNIRLIKRFAQTISELACGELDEILAAWKTDIDRKSYNERIYNKTATLFCTAALGGALLADGDEESIIHLNNYGYNLGMAYQIYDDILDYVSTPDRLGKPSGNDISEGTITLPAIIAYENDGATIIERFFEADEKQREQLLAEVIHMVKKTGAIKTAQGIADDYIKKAHENLETMPKSKNRESLDLLADYVAKRSY